MSSDILVNSLEEVGWRDFAPGEFLKVDFDNIGKARIAKNNWFVLLKSVPVLDVAEIEYHHQWRRLYPDVGQRSETNSYAQDCQAMGLVAGHRVYQPNKSSFGCL